MASFKYEAASIATLLSTELNSLANGSAAAPCPIAQFRSPRPREAWALASASPAPENAASRM